MDSQIDKKLALIIPAYNEEKRIKPFLDSVYKYYRARPGQISEIIVVDDGSQDGTARIVNAYVDKMPLRIIKHASNQGKGAAVQTGVRVAQGELIVFMDADGATPITELGKMLTALQTADIAVGNRWMPKAVAYRHSWLRRWSGFIYRQYMALFGLRKVDTMCGFKGYKRKVAQDLFTGLLDKRWLFDTEIAYKAIKRGYKIKNFPIQWESKDGSKLSSVTLLKSALRIWPLIKRIKATDVV